MASHAMLGVANGRILPDSVSRQGRSRTPRSCTPLCVANSKRGGEQTGQSSRLSPPPAQIPANRPEASKPETSPVSTSAQSDSTASAITGQVTSWWQAYTRRLEIDPVRTKAVTSFLGFMIGDFLAQRIGGEQFSPLRCLRLGAYGLFLDGPIGHWWYKILDKNVLPDRPRSTQAVLVKTAADQLIWAPIMTVVFFAVLKSLEGHPELIWETVQDKLVKTVVANYILWPGAHFINFKFVPTEHRILYNNCVSVVWNAYLSTLSHAPEIDPAKVLDQVSSLSETAANTAASIPQGLGLTSGPVQLPPFERLLPEGATFPDWFHDSQQFGPIKLAPFERLLPQNLNGFVLPRKILLAPTRAMYPMWLQPLLQPFLGGDGSQ